VGRVLWNEMAVSLELIPSWMISISCLRVAAAVSLATASISGRA